MSSPTTYELFAIKYAAIDRPAPENFVFRDVHDGPMPLDFFLWVAKSPERTFVIDTGFSEETGARRNRTVIRNPREGLAALDIDAAQIDDVIITHMHHDHVGNFEIFPRARFHLQDREMAYATGRYMCHPRLRMPFDIENVTGMVREVHRGASRSTTATTSSLRASACIWSAATAPACSSCACTRGAAGSWSPRTRSISMPMSRPAIRFRSCSTSAT